MEIKKLELWTKKELPDRLKLRSANLTKNIEEVFSMTEKDINSLEQSLPLRVYKVEMSIPHSVCAEVSKASNIPRD